MKRPNNLKAGDKFILAEDYCGWKSGEIIYIIHVDDAGGVLFCSESRRSGSRWIEFSHIKPYPSLRELPHTVVHCKTQKEYDELMQIYEDAGWKWNEGQNATYKNNWTSYKGETCVLIKDGFCYCPAQPDRRDRISYYRLNGYKILSLQEFKEEQGLVERTTCTGRTTAPILTVPELERLYGGILMPILSRRSYKFPEPQKQKKGTMSLLKKLTNTIKNYFSEEVQALYRLGWAEMENDELDITSEGSNELERFLAFEHPTISKAFGEYAKKRVAEVEKEEKKK